MGRCKKKGCKRWVYQGSESPWCEQCTRQDAHIMAAIVGRLEASEALLDVLRH